MREFDIIIRTERRDCRANGRPGFWHLWVTSNDSVYGLVELSDGMHYIDARKIEFVDEVHAYLHTLEKHEKEFTND